MPNMDTEWKIEKEPINYTDAVNFMEERVKSIREDKTRNLVWLLEHPNLYTAGTSAEDKDLLNKNIPVFKSGRGGQYTYHGPGQRIAYVMLDLKTRGSDVRKYVYDLEDWIIKTLATLGVTGERREGRVGIWVVNSDGSEDKIAAIGVRIRKWVSYHGIAINLNPDLSYYSGIVPCGIKQHGVTSLEKLGINISQEELDKALKENWNKVF